MDYLKPIIISDHASESMILRGALPEEVEKTILIGERKSAKDNRWQAELDFEYNNVWYDRWYKTKRVKVIFSIETDSIIVITVITFYF